MDEKILFKCKHCENDDIRYFIFNSLEYQSEQYANSPYRQNWNREATPKIPIGIHIKCSKCNKDTFFVPAEYKPTMWGNDIPEQCIVNVKHEQPEYSAIKYAMSDDGYLDQIVVTSNNKVISLLTKQEVPENTYNVISQKQYLLLLQRGLTEIGNTHSNNSNTNNINNTELKKNDVKNLEKGK